VRTDQPAKSRVGFPALAIVKEEKNPWQTHSFTGFQKETGVLHASTQAHGFAILRYIEGRLPLTEPTDRDDCRSLPAVDPKERGIVITAPAATGTQQGLSPSAEGDPADLEVRGIRWGAVRPMQNKGRQRFLIEMELYRQNSVAVRNPCVRHVRQLRVECVIGDGDLLEHRRIRVPRVLEEQHPLRGGKVIEVTHFTDEVQAVVANGPTEGLRPSSRLGRHIACRERPVVDGGRRRLTPIDKSEREERGIPSRKSASKGFNPLVHTSFSIECKARAAVRRTVHLSSPSRQKRSL